MSPPCGPFLARRSALKSPVLPNPGSRKSLWESRRSRRSRKSREDGLGWYRRFRKSLVSLSKESRRSMLDPEWRIPWGREELRGSLESESRKSPPGGCSRRSAVGVLVNERSLRSSRGRPSWESRRSLYLSLSGRLDLTSLAFQRYATRTVNCLTCYRLT